MLKFNFINFNENGKNLPIHHPGYATVWLQNFKNYINIIDLFFLKLP